MKAVLGGFGVVKLTQQVFLANFLRANFFGGRPGSALSTRVLPGGCRQWEFPVGMSGQVSGPQTEGTHPTFKRGGLDPMFMGRLLKPFSGFS